MTALLINSREALEALESSGLPREQAREIVKVFEQIDTGHLSTKADLVELKAELIKFMFVQSLTIVGLTVALLKFL